MHSNCLIYALGKLIREGGYLVIRRSRSFKLLPHFLHLSGDGHVLSHFQPANPVSGWRALFSKLRFTGEVKYDDPKN